jgi:hypothetical protein
MGSYYSPSADHAVYTRYLRIPSVKFRATAAETVGILTLSPVWAVL